MNSLATTLDLDQLRAELDALEYEVNAYGILWAVHQGQPLPPWSSSGEVSAALVEIAALTGLTPRHLMANILPAGLKLPIHVDRLDGGKNGQRWHLPVATNPGCSWWDMDGGSVPMTAGYWWGPCPNRSPHTFANLGRTPRLHLIVDLAP